MPVWRFGWISTAIVACWFTPTTDASSVRCVPTPSRPANTFSPFGSAAAYGPGPIYPVIRTRHGHAVFARSTRPDGFSGFKVLWITQPRYRGSFVVTGRRKDRAGRLRFVADDAVGGDNLNTTATFRRAATRVSGWRGSPSTVLVRSPGCYVFTIAGSGFRRHITVRVAR